MDVSLGILLVQGLDHVVPEGLSTILLLSEYQLSEKYQYNFSFQNKLQAKLHKLQISVILNAEV